MAINEAEKQKRRENWAVGIGLQKVDGLEVSSYLRELTELHIEGKITMDEVEKRLKKHYETKQNKENK